MKQDPMPVFLSPLLFKKDHLERIIQFFHIFSSETRWELFYQLYTEEGTLSVDELAVKMKLSQASISYHLDQFQRAGLVSNVKYGIYHYYQIRWQAFREIQSMLEEQETESRPFTR